MEHLSLRVKLIAVMALIVALASFPLIYLSYQDSYDRAIESAKVDFDNSVSLIEEGLKLSYLTSQTMLTEKMRLERTWLYEVLDSYEKYIEQGREGELSVIAQWNRANETHTAKIAPDGTFVLSSGIIEDLYKRNVKDFMDVSLREYRDLLRDTQGGQYSAFFSDHEATGRTVPVFVAFRRTADGSFLLAAEELTYLEGALKSRQEATEEHLKNVINAMDDVKGTVAVISGSGQHMMGRGEGALFDHLADHPEVYKVANEEGRAEGVIDVDGRETLYSLSYFRPRDWYIETTVPTDVVTAPARIYALKLTTIVILIFTVLAMLGLGTVTRVLKPLRSVAESAGRLGMLNLATKTVHDDLTEIRQALPPIRGDEVGQVANAFRHLTLAMEKNIDDLKKSMSKQHSMEGELHAASEIQKGMITVGPEGVKGRRFEAAAIMKAAKEVGGDLFDVVKAPDGRKAILLGDVSGKGVSAALLMCITLTLARLGISRGMTPAETMKLVNDQIASNNPSCMFVTLWIGLFNTETGELVFANGGHPAPCIVPADGSVRWERELSGPLVGVMEEAQFTDHATTLEKGELMLVYSDGVTEAMNEQRDLFEEKGLEKAAAGAAGKSPKVLVDRVLDGIIAHRGLAEQSDDITMVAFMRKEAEA